MGKQQNDMNMLMTLNLQQPEYLHVLLNPIPVYGLTVGVLVSVVALILRSREAQWVALWVIFISASSAWPTYVLGQRAYNPVYLKADADGQSSLDAHKDRAAHCIVAFYGLAIMALLALIIPRRVPKTAVPLALATLVVSLGCLGMGAWISKAGGQVRHPEFRNEGQTQSATTNLNNPQSRK